MGQMPKWLLDEDADKKLISGEGADVVTYYRWWWRYKLVLEAGADACENFIFNFKH